MTVAVCLVSTVSKVVNVIAHCLRRVDLILNNFYLHFMRNCIHSLVCIIRLYNVFTGKRSLELTSFDVFRPCIKTPLLQAEVVHLHCRSLFKHCCKCNCTCSNYCHALVFKHRSKSSTVVNTGKCCNRVEKVAVAALEEVRKFLFRSAFNFFFAALDKEVLDLFYSRAAEGMTHNVDLLVSLSLAKVFKNTVLKSLAVTSVAELFRVNFTKVYCTAEEVSPEDAGSVPCTVERAKRRAENLCAVLLADMLVN